MQENELDSDFCCCCCQIHAKKMEKKIKEQSKVCSAPLVFSEVS